MLTLASRLDLISTRLQFFLADFWSHTYISVEEISHTAANSMVGSMSRDKSRICWMVMLGWIVLRVPSRALQTEVDDGQLNRWERSSRGC